jgi:hypothetical protein
MNENTEKQNHWKKIYFLGGVVAFIVFGLTITDIIIGLITSADLTLLPQTATERFLEFKESWLIGLNRLDMLNVIISAAMIPVFFALCVIHREIKPATSTLTLILFLVATTIFITTNTALPMLQLSGKYFSTTSETQRALYASAGEALLVRGEHGTPGVFIGFFLLTLSNLFISFVMLNAGIFKKIVGYLGIIGSFSLLIYIFLVTFFSSIKSIAVIIAAPGGILVLVWYLFIAIKLINVGLEKINDK